MDLLADMPSLRSMILKSPQGVVHIPASITALSCLSALSLRFATVSGHIDALQDLRSLAELDLSVLDVEGDAEEFMDVILGHTQVPSSHPYAWLAMSLSLLTPSSVRVASCSCERALRHQQRG